MVLIGFCVWFVVNYCSVAINGKYEHVILIINRIKNRFQITLKYHTQQVIKKRKRKKNALSKEEIRLKLLLLLLTSPRSTKPPEANIATYAPPRSLSIQSLPLYTLPGNSHFSLIFPYDILPPRLVATCFLFGLRRLASKDHLWQSVILHPQNLAISTCLSL